MADDGNRQVALTLDTVKVAVGLSEAQFNVLEMELNGINSAVNKLAENVAEPDTSVAAEIQSLKEVVSVGFNDVRQSITDLNNVIFERSVDLAKWLAAIALAASTPDDNSAAVQAQIDKHAAEIRTEREKLQSSLNRNQPEGE